jgi:hypothetical protein
MLNTVFLNTIFTYLAPLIYTSLGAFITYKYGIKQFKFEEEKKLILQKITNFYSPLIVLQKEIESLLETKRESSYEADEACRNRYKDEKTYSSYSYFERKKYTKKLEEAINHENTIFPNKILPIYDKMLEIFKNNYWLAENSTQNFYKIFVKYVRKEHAWYEPKAPGTGGRTDVEKNDIEFFYEDLKKNLNKLKDQFKTL